MGDSFAAGLAAYAPQCARLGVSGFTDATPGRDQADIEEFARLSAAGIFGQRLVLMAPPGLTEPAMTDPAAGRVSLGPVKVMLDDTLLPETDELAAAIGLAHQSGSAVAVHCVTAEELIVAVTAFEQVGSAGDRIEHASVVPPGYSAQLAGLGLTVVTQPGFIGAHGDHYLRAVPAAEQDWLYPCASLLRAGTVVVAGTDAPFGPADPWRCVASAVTRSTRAGPIPSVASGCQPGGPSACSWGQPTIRGAGARSRPASRPTCAYCVGHSARSWPTRLPPASGPLSSPARSSDRPADQ